MLSITRSVKSKKTLAKKLKKKSKEEDLKKKKKLKESEEKKDRRPSFQRKDPSPAGGGKKSKGKEKGSDKDSESEHLAMGYGAKKKKGNDKDGSEKSLDKSTFNDVVKSEQSQNFVDGILKKLNSDYEKSKKIEAGEKKGLIALAKAQDAGMERARMDSFSLKQFQKGKEVEAKGNTKDIDKESRLDTHASSRGLMQSDKASSISSSKSPLFPKERDGASMEPPKTSSSGSSSRSKGMEKDSGLNPGKTY